MEITCMRIMVGIWGDGGVQSPCYFDGPGYDTLRLGSTRGKSERKKGQKCVGILAGQRRMGVHCWLDVYTI